MNISANSVKSLQTSLKAGIGNGTVTIQNRSALAYDETAAVGKSAASSLKAQKDKKQTTKKKLNYNPREVRSALLRAKRSQSAGMVLATAKSKLSNLLKCKSTGQYEDSELNAAITHARRMVRCAQMKTQNLRREEQTKSRIQKESQREESERAMKKAQIERLEQKRLLELSRKRQSNRNFEKSQMDAADREYKNGMSQNQGAGNGEFFLNGSYLGDVLVEISQKGAQLSEEQLEAMLPDMGIQMDTSVDMSAGIDGAAVMAASAAEGVSL